MSQAAAGQEALDKKVGMLETHQREVHDALAAMEAEAQRLYQVGRVVLCRVFCRVSLSVCQYLDAFDARAKARSVFTTFQWERHCKKDKICR